VGRRLPPESATQDLAINRRHYTGLSAWANNLARRPRNGRHTLWANSVEPPYRPYACGNAKKVAGPQSPATAIERIGLVGFRAPSGETSNNLRKTSPAASAESYTRCLYPKMTHSRYVPSLASLRVIGCTPDRYGQKKCCFLAFFLLRHRVGLCSPTNPAARRSNPARSLFFAKSPRPCTGS